MVLYKIGGTNTGTNQGGIVKLFENFSLEDLLIKIFVPDSKKSKIVDPFDKIIKDNKDNKDNKKDQNKYKHHKKSG